jgi:hypothetical protein
MKTLRMLPGYPQPLSSRVPATPAVACSSWRIRQLSEWIGSRIPFVGLGFAGSGFGFGTLAVVTTDTGANHTHKPYHQRPKEMLL